MDVRLPSTRTSGVQQGAAGARSKQAIIPASHSTPPSDTISASILPRLGWLSSHSNHKKVIAFIATLMDSGVEFIAVDNPHANKLTIHILAAVAQHEREIISARTSAALKAAKARGKRLGNPKLSEARQLAAAGKRQRADQYSANILPLIREIQASGVKSLRGIARALAARGIAT